MSRGAGPRARTEWRYGDNFARVCRRAGLALVTVTPPPEAPPFAATEAVAVAVAD
ncbi:hypothetical protein ACFVBM_15205 [Streptomyces griseus]|uniref:hypothetical protein n=1 Tax=Streptomyces griseus TaxID=1911 RepID=UPI0036B0E320